MAAHLAREDGVHLAHALDEGVADAVHQRGAAEPLDDVADGPARADVVDDRPPGLLLQHGLGEERRDEVTGHELARVVHEEAAVGVAVEGDPEVGALLDHLATTRGSPQERVRLVVGEVAVGLEEAAHGVDRQPVEDGREHRAAHAVGRVDDDAERLHRARVDEGQDLVDEARVDVARLDLHGSDPRHVRQGQGAVADVEQAGVGADGQRPRRTIFAPV